MGKKRSVPTCDWTEKSRLVNEFRKILTGNVSDDSRLLGVSGRQVYYYLTYQRIPSLEVLNRIKHLFSKEAQGFIEYYESL
jgi:predicted transcriptional regulator